MKRTTHLGLLAIWCAGMIGVQAQQVWDFCKDWSDERNPNPPWSYNSGPNPLPHVDDWPQGNFACVQPGWANGNTIPFWWRARCPGLPSQGWETGDCLVHSGDEGQANVTWTSPIDGVIDLSGGVWMTHYFPGRANRWKLYVRDALVAQGQLSGTDAYNRANLFEYAKGADNPAALTNVRVSKGDVVKLDIARAETFGTVVGVELKITQVWSLVTSIEVADVRVCWTSRTGKSYQVEYRSSLTGDAWQPLGDPVPGSGGVDCIVDPVLGKAARTYRVVELP